MIVGLWAGGASQQRQSAGLSTFLALGFLSKSPVLALPIGAPKRPDFVADCWWIFQLRRAPRHGCIKSRSEHTGLAEQMFLLRRVILGFQAGLITKTGRLNSADASWVTGKSANNFVFPDGRRAQPPCPGGTAACPRLGLHKDPRS